MDKSFYFSVASALIPVIIGLGFSGSKSKNGKLITTLSCISLSCDGLSYLWAVTYGNNYWVIHAYHVLELILLGFFYAHFLRRTAHLYFWLCFLAIYLCDVLFFTGFHQINSLLIGVESLIFILYGVLGYYYMFQNQEYMFLDKSPDFWFNTGIITYFSGALFSWLMFYMLHHKDGGGAGIWVFHNMANILKNILFSIGLWKVRTN